MSKIIEILNSRVSKNSKIVKISDIFYRQLSEEDSMFNLSFVLVYLESKKVDKVIRDMKLDKNHVIDENKSVKWNRDRIKCANEHIKRKKKRSLTKDLVYYDEIIREVIIRLYSDIYKISENKVAVVYDKYFNFDTLYSSNDYMKKSLSLLLDIANLN